MATRFEVCVVTVSRKIAKKTYEIIVNTAPERVIQLHSGWDDSIPDAGMPVVITINGDIVTDVKVILTSDCTVEGRQ